MDRAGYKSIRVSSWEDLRSVLADHRGWAFRGQKNADWHLHSGLSRYLIDFGVHRNAWRRQEERILRIFSRKAHLLLTHIPDANDLLEWLALMQHHGAPTRLIDFTWSPYVAAFFALERAPADAAIWAIFPSPVPKTMGELYRQFLEKPERSLAVGEPTRMNQRLVAQAGTFVMPGTLDEPIESLAPPNTVVRIVLDTARIRRTSMEELYNMNITNATLFPGLDGLARSLSYELEYNWEFDPITLQRKLMPETDAESGGAEEETGNSRMI